MIKDKATKQKSVSEAEKEILGFWQKNDIFQKSLDARKACEPYIFYDGPPFATGTPHYGHILASVVKDVVPRYQTMRGYYVPRRWGWDCHGLPIENIVEKELGFKHKKDILNFGVDKFNELCRARVLTYVDEWKKVIPRIGRWADMDEPYFTMSREFMETVWWVFKQLYDKDLVYEDYRSMHICPRCETTLSQSEVAEGYKTVKDLTATVKFHLMPGQSFGNGKYQTKDSTYILAWTTTPWTLPGNVALAVGPIIQYTALRIVGVPDLLIVASERVEEVFEGKEIEIIHDDIVGTDLVGLAYKPLFNTYAADLQLEHREAGWKVYAADFVTTVDGTGVVHIAPAFGADDMELGKQEALPFVQHVSMDGIIKPEVTELAGRSVKPIDDIQSTDVEVVRYLAAKNLLFAKLQYEHSYSHCWRCDTPLINYATSSWFVRIERGKEALLRSAEQINWSPAHMKQGRWGNWLEGARDWSISRQRFWASVIPIWRCTSCQAMKVFGSASELEVASGQTINDLHKHVVDTVTIPCSCGQAMHRVPDVLDTWFDSGSMPYGSSHYPFENKEQFDQTFPSQFIAEGQDQTRAWFYYLHVLATSLFGHEAFENVIVNGTILAKDGKKMSKRLQNYPDPMSIVDSYGADALRCYLLSSSLMKAEDLNFSEQGVDGALKKIILRLKNVLAFYQLYPATQSAVATQDSTHVLDRWILARLHQLIGEVTEAMDHYELDVALRPIEAFIDDLSVWYVRRSRDRMKEEGSLAASQTLRYVLRELSKLMAPFTPFIAEEVYLSTKGADDLESVHLADWPITEKIDQVGPPHFRGHLGGEWPVSSEVKEKVRKPYQDIIENMERVRKLATIGHDLRTKLGHKVRQALKIEAITIVGEPLNDEYIEVLADELNVIGRIEQRSGLDADAVFYQKLDEELLVLGLEREFIHTIQQLRKQANMVQGDIVTVTIEGEHPLKQLVKMQASEIEKKTSTKIVWDERVGPDAVKVDGLSISLKL